MLRKIGTFNYALFLPLVSIAVQLQISSNVASVRCECMLYVLVIIATHPKGNIRRNLYLQ